MKITIETVAHKDQRYPTVGDWFYDDAGNLIIRVSQLSDWRYEVLVAVHELIEVLVCKHDGVPQEAVDSFDCAYEAARKDDDISEPGDHPKAPYRRQHSLATGVERVLAVALGVGWAEYESEIESL